MSALMDPREELAQLRVPPHSAEAEYSVLGCLLIDNRAWDRVGDTLTEADFYRPEHKAIFAAIAKLIASSKPADVVTVFDALAEKAEEVGGLKYLNEIAQSVPSAANARRYAEIVRERSMLRTVVGKVDEAQAIAFGEGEVADKLDRIGALFAGIEARNAKRAPVPMSEIMLRVIDNINAAAEGVVTAWRTGIAAFDSRLNGGLQPGKLVIVAARPAVGKSSLSLQIAARVASDGHPAAILSQEMEMDEVGERGLVNAARVPYGAVLSGKLNELQWGNLSEGVEKLGHLPLWVDDEPALTLRAINAKARSIKDLKVLVVDYIQLSEGEGDTRSAQVGSISRGLKKLAKELGICVIALSQLNREVDKRPGRRPQMSDLRDSGEIEQDADAIVFLWPLDEGEDDAQVRHIGCEFAKNRRGRRGASVLMFEGALQLWRESDRSIDSFSKTAKRGNFE
jgi:replicative DNA helicase